MKRKATGFTLLELVIALSLSTMVLIGIMVLTSSMVRYQFEGVKKGQVAGLSLYALDQMNKELEDATHMEQPPVTGGSVLAGCINWNRQGSGMNPLPGSVGTQVSALGPSPTWFYYCVDGNNSLWRYSGANCPFPVAIPVTCGTASGVNSIVVFQNFFHQDGFPTSFFQRKSDGGVDLHYIVGVSTPNLAGYSGGYRAANPVYYKFDYHVGMNKNFSSND